MATKLKNLWYRAIALVDKGANHEADIVLAKRDDTQKNEDEGYASMEECMGALKDEAKCKALMAAMKRAEQGDGMPDKLPEEVSKALAEVADLKKRAETAEAETKAAKDRIAKMEDENAAKAAIAKVETFKSLPVEAAKFAPIYRKMTAGLTAEEVAEVDKVFHAASEQIAAGKLLAEVGSGAGSAGGDAYAKLQALANTFIQKDGKLTAAQAMVKAVETPEGRKLQDQYDRERAEATRGR